MVANIENGIAHKLDCQPDLEQIVLMFTWTSVIQTHPAAQPDRSRLPPARGRDLAGQIAKDESDAASRKEGTIILRFRTTPTPLGESSHHALQPDGLADAFRNLRARPVVVVERHAELLSEC